MAPLRRLRSNHLRATSAIPLLLAISLFANSLVALNVKVLLVDHREGRITVLLPMHNASLEAQLAPEEPEIRVRKNSFYEAEVESGMVNTRRQNWLRIKIPDQRPVRFRLRKITFHD
jgi:hypothetical protein